MSPPASPTSLAVLAVEVRLAEREAALTEVCFALQLEAMIAGRYRSQLEVIAARIGLSRDATGLVLDQWEYRGRLLNEAHLLLRALIPFEAHIRDLIAAAPSYAPDTSIVPLPAVDGLPSRELVGPAA